jgi:hypothetical protein
MLETLRQYPYLLFLAVMTPIAGVLIGMYVLFRRARRETCTWPRWLRRVAQAPGWLLVALGVYEVIGLAVLEIREKRVGLGTGTCVAVIGATIKGLTRAVRRDPPASAPRPTPAPPR